MVLTEATRKDSNMKLKYHSFLKRKWDRIFFVFFDLNKSGTIDYNDFEVLFEELMAIRGEEEEEGEAEEYKIYMNAVWKGLLCSTKNLSMDEEPPKGLEVNLDEWREMWAKYDPDNMSYFQYEYLKFMFFLLDSSGDQYIDVEEYIEVMKIYKLDEDESVRSFDKLLDTEGARKQKMIEYTDFIRLWNEYFTSTNESAHGNNLFGEFDKAVQDKDEDEGEDEQDGA